MSSNFCIVSRVAIAQTPACPFLLFLTWNHHPGTVPSKKFACDGFFFSKKSFPCWASSGTGLLLPHLAKSFTCNTILEESLRVHRFLFGLDISRSRLPFLLLLFMLAIKGAHRPIGARSLGAVTNERIAFSVLHGRFVVKLCLSQL